MQSLKQKQNTRKMENGKWKLFNGIKLCIHPSMVPNKDPSMQEIATLVRLGGGIFIPTPQQLLDAYANSSSSANPPNAVAAPATASNTTANGPSGIIRFPSSAADSPGPIYLLMRSDSSVVWSLADIQSLGNRLGMIPVSIMWFLECISCAAITDVQLFRLDKSQSEKAEYLKTKQLLLQQQQRQQQEQQQTQHQAPQVS